MPTTLADVFEFMVAVDVEPLKNLDSTLWTFLTYLQLQDMLNLRKLCKSSAQLAGPEQQALAIRIGQNMLGDLRAVLW